MSSTYNNLNKPKIKQQQVKSIVRHSSVKSSKISVNNNPTIINTNDSSVNDNDVFSLNDSQSTTSNSTSLEDLNDDFMTNKSEFNKFDPNYLEQRASRMMNIKFSDTYKEVISSLLKEKLLAYSQQYKSYLKNNKDECSVTKDEVESLSKVNIEKKTPKLKKVVTGINRRSSNAFMKPAIKSSRTTAGTASPTQNKKVFSFSSQSKLDETSEDKKTARNRIVLNAINNVYFANSQNKRPSIISTEESTHYHENGSFKRLATNVKAISSFANSVRSQTSGNLNSRTNSITPHKFESSSNQSFKTKTKSSASSFKSENSTLIRLTDLVFEGYSKRDLELINKQSESEDQNFMTHSERSFTIEPDYISPSFKIVRYDRNNPKELELAKQDIFKRYAFIEDPNIRAKSVLPLNFVVPSKISSSFNRLRAH